MIMKPFVRHLRSLSAIAGGLVCAGLTGACIYEYPDEDCVDGTDIVFLTISISFSFERPRRYLLFVDGLFCNVDLNG